MHFGRLKMASNNIREGLWSREGLWPSKRMDAPCCA